MTEQDQRGGWLYGVAAFGLWGVFPLYFRSLHGVPPLEILAHRILWCLLCLTVDSFRAARGRPSSATLSPPEGAKTEQLGREPCVS